MGGYMILNHSIVEHQHNKDYVMIIKFNNYTNVFSKARYLIFKISDIFHC